MIINNIFNSIKNAFFGTTVPTNQFCTTIIPLLEGLSEIRDKERVIKFCLSIPQEKLALVIKKVTPLFHDRYCDGATKIYILEKSFKIPEDLRALVMEIAIPSMQNAPWPYRCSILSAIRKAIELLPENKRKSLQGEKLVIEIAKLAAQFLFSFNGISEHIHNFGIKDESALIEIAKLAAQHKCEGTSRFIKNYGIKNKKALIEIATIAMNSTQIFPTPCRYIQNYDVDEQSSLIELAKQAAPNCGLNLSEHIQKFGIKDKSALIDIAKLVAKYDGVAIAFYFQNFDIDDKRIVIEIAKMAIQNCPVVSKHIQNFGIKDESTLVEIAKLGVQNDGWGIFHHIEEYLFFKDKNKVLEILLDCMRYHPDISKHVLAKIIELFCTNPQISARFEKMCEGQEESIKTIFDFIFEQIEKMKGKKEQEQKMFNTIYWTAYAHLLIKIKTPDLSLAEKKLFTEIASYPEPRMRFEFTYLFCDVFANETHRQNYRRLISSEGKGKGKVFQEEKGKGDCSINLMLPALFLCQMSDSINPDLIEAITERDFHDGRLFKRLVDTMHCLTCSKAKELLTDEQVLVVLHKALMIEKKKKHAMDRKKLLEDQKQLKKNQKKFKKDQTKLTEEKKLEEQKLIENQKKLTEEETKLTEEKKLIQKQRKLNLFTLQGIAEGGGLSLLKESLDKGQEDLNLNLIYQTTFKQLIPISENIHEFEEKYLKTFGNQREASALLTYAGRLNLLKPQERDEALQTLAFYVSSVLEGDFEEKRYTESPHLSFIFQKRPELEEEWKKGASRNLDSVNILSEEKGFIDNPADFYINFFKNKILQDKHLNPEDFHYIKEYLTQEDQRENIEKILENEIKSASNRKDPIEPLLLQMQMIKLINNHEFSKNISLFLEMLQCLTAIKNSDEFANDINGLLEGLKRQSKGDQTYTGFTIVDTDNFWDLFLCGTEVEGSCQRVNGDPDKNKCLMGYLIDGKIRLLAVKNDQGKIVARSIIRLLWDQNNSEPVLMMERFYPDVIAPQLLTALDQFAKDRARSLGLKLFKAGNLPVLFISRGGRAPWEYVDSADGWHVKKGQYEIKSAQQS
jgi:hypothetical protein